MLSDDERQGRLIALNELIEIIRPAVQADVEEGVVEVILQGACSSCAVSASTLQAGITRIMKDRLKWVTEVIGGVDEDMDIETSVSMGRGGYVPKDEAVSLS